MLANAPHQSSQNGEEEGLALGRVGVEWGYLADGGPSEDTAPLPFLPFRQS